MISTIKISFVLLLNETHTQKENWLHSPTTNFPLNFLFGFRHGPAYRRDFQFIWYSSVNPMWSNGIEKKAVLTRNQVSACVRTQILQAFVTRGVCRSSFDTLFMFTSRPQWLGKFIASKFARRMKIAFMANGVAVDGVHVYVPAPLFVCIVHLLAIYSINRLAGNKWRMKIRTTTKTGPKTKTYGKVKSRLLNGSNSAIQTMIAVNCNAIKKNWFHAIKRVANRVRLRTKL